MKIVVPMAGRGQRFAELAGLVANYTVPKPMIRVMDRPMVRWSIDSYRSFLALNGEAESPVRTSDLVFICLREHEIQFNISEFLKRIFDDRINIIFTEEVTRGPAETALLAERFIDSDEDVIISDCDHHFDAAPLWEAIKANFNESDYVGILPLMKPEDAIPSWSYVVLNANEDVIEIREKDAELAKMMAYGVIGAYYFRRGKDFVAEAKRMIMENDSVGEENKTEFYISRVYQRLINRSKHVKAAFIAHGHILGTPRQLQKFLDIYGKQQKGA